MDKNYNKYSFIPFKKTNLFKTKRLKPVEEGKVFYKLLINNNILDLIKYNKITKMKDIVVKKKKRIRKRFLYTKRSNLKNFFNNNIHNVHFLKKYNTLYNKDSFENLIYKSNY